MARRRVLPLLLAAVAVGPSSLDAAIPYFARRYNVRCQHCHVAPPMLNAVGEAFLAGGYRMPGQPSSRTWPFALWMSGRADRPALAPDVRDRVITYLNRIEVISGGALVLPSLAYFVEWRAVSFEVRSDGTLRDRSGRFEDIFLTGVLGDRLEVFLGQFRQVQQVDVSRRLGVSEPVLLSASVAGTGGDTPRLRSLRAFAPAGRSPAVRAGWVEPLSGGWRWTSAFAVPFPGEFSIPLTAEARGEASNELALDPKGLFVESFVRRGLASFGAHVFFDHSQRYLVTAATTGSRGVFHWIGMVGALKGGETLRGRWSLEGLYVPHPLVGGGGRVEDVAGDNIPPVFAPYVNAHFPGTRYTFRLTIEHRFQLGRNVTLVEVGTVF